VVITAYTDSRDSWTTEHAALQASHLLDTSLPERRTRDFIVGSILKDYLRPLFSKSTSKVTASGRPSQFRNQEQVQRDGLEPPSWKKQGPMAIAILRWAVKTSKVGSCPQSYRMNKQVLTWTE
jgi:hypothetical protein